MYFITTVSSNSMKIEVQLLIIHAVTESIPNIFTKFVMSLNALHSQKKTGPNYMTVGIVW